jgi:hypothetical protein
MYNHHFNKKILTSCLKLSIPLVGMITPFRFTIKSISAKTGTSEKTSSDSLRASADTNNKNNAIIFNALESKNETYRWQNTSQRINPTLNLIAHTYYAIKIKNPTNAKHEIIIGTNRTEPAKSNSINPGKKQIWSSMLIQRGVFEYHCEYHPDTMKGVIEISSQ